MLYPVKNKEYFKDPYLSNSWDCARLFFKKDLILTIFGYSAPESDFSAVGLLQSAWMNEKSREIEHVETIDIICENELHRRWKKFSPNLHLHPRQKFNESWIAMWPRRSREAVFLAMSEGIPCREFPLSYTDDLTKLQSQVREIAKWETGARQKKR